MKGKIIIIIIAAAVAVGGALALLRPKHRTPIAPVASSSGAASSALPAASEIAPAPSGALATLSSDVQALVLFKPRNIDAAVKRWQKLRDKVVATAAWKKLHLGEQLEQKFKEGVQQGEQQSPGGPTPEELQAGWDKFLGRWQGLDEAFVAVTSHTNVVKVQDKDTSIPGVLLRLSFTSPEAAKTSFDELAAKLLEGAGKKDPPEAQVTRKSESELEIVWHDASGAREMSGSLRLDGANITALVGAAEADFFTADASRRLVESPAWKTAGTLDTANSAFTGFFNVAALTAALDTLAGALPPDAAGGEDNAKKMKAAIDVYRDFEAVSFAVDLSSGLHLTSCIQPKPGSAYDKLYTEMAARHAAGKAGLSETPALLDSTTVLGVGLSLDMIRDALDTASEQIRGAMGSQADSVETKTFLAIMNTARNVLDRLKLKEFGLFISPPLMPPIIGAGVLLGGSELKGEALLKEVAASLNEINTTIATAGGNPGAPEIAHFAAGENGQPSLKLNIAGVELVGAVAREDSVIISIDSSIVETMKRRVEKGGNYFEKFTAQPELAKMIADANYFVYLNTGTFIDLGRNFLPLLLAQQPQPEKLEMADADEVLEMLKFAYLSFQRSYHLDGTLCSDSRSYVVE